MNEALLDCYNTIKKLRDPISGCPWDLEQTHESLIKYMIEEAYELAEAIHSGNDTKIKDELGDVLLQVFLHSIMANEKKKFDLSEVANNLKEKIIRRHPHVFNVQEPSQENKISSAQVVENWAKIKQMENPERNSSKSILKDWAALPSLMASYKIGQATKKVNFDWDSHTQVAYKVEEEWQELKEELMASRIDQQRAREEIGDLLFSMAQLARHLDIEPEEALAGANRKFSRRFNSMEKLVAQAGKKMEDMTQSELDQFWNQVKFNEKT